MSGGKSSSSSTQQTSQSTTAQDASGIVGDVIQGTTITITEAIPENLQKAFGDIISLAKQTTEAAIGAGQFAIDTVSDVKTTSISPETTQIKSLVPVLSIAGVALIVFAFMRGK